MNQFRIGARLALSFGVVLAITAVIALLGIAQLGKAREVSREIATVQLQRSLLAQRWASQIGLNWERASASLHTQDSGYQQRLQAEMAATSKAISDDQQQLEALVDDEDTKALMASVADHRKTYVDARAALIRRQQQGEDIAAAIDGELRPLAQTYLKPMAGGGDMGGMGGMM